MGDTQFIQTRCVECPRVVETEVDSGTLDKFMMRWETVQVLFNDRTVDEREAIMGYRSGYYLCPTCWNKYIEEDDDTTE